MLNACLFLLFLLLSIHQFSFFRWLIVFLADIFDVCIDHGVKAMIHSRDVFKDIQKVIDPSRNWKGIFGLLRCTHQKWKVRIGGELLIPNKKDMQIDRREPEYLQKAQNFHWTVCFWCLILNFIQIMTTYGCNASIHWPDWM